METVQHCPSCGTRLGGNAPEGLCPSCLLQAALGIPESAPPIETVPAGKVFGDYEILAPLGQGGMGVVYAARQISLNRPVALKMVRAPHLASDSELARFRQEAEAAARLDHPNIVPVYEAGERDGVQYFTMKLVEGARSLASDLVNGPMNPRDAAKLMLKIARAVHYAHQRGVIHRDIKPANILMDSSGEPQLADFGLAKLLETAISLTQADRVIGTPQYMSPEQVHGHSRELTTATDIYSLGAVFYEMLTGRPPFHSVSIHEILRQVAEKEPRSPRSLNSLVDRDLQTICMKCLEKIPVHRYASANDLADDLESWMDVRPIAARPVTGVERLAKWGRRNPLVAGLGGALTAVGFLAVGILFKNYYQYRVDLIHRLDGAVHEASLSRTKGKEGRRWEAMALIDKARKIMEDPALPREEAARVESDLRNEAIACLSIVDVRPAESWRSRGETTLSPDFSRYAEALRDGRIVVSGYPRHEELVSWRIEGALPRGLRFSGDGKRLAVLHNSPGTAATRLTIFEVLDAKPVSEREAPDGGIFDLSPDGARLVYFADSEIRVLEIATDTMVAHVRWDEAPGTLRFSPDGRRIAVMQRDGTVRLIDVLTGEVAVCTEAVQARSLAWDAKGQRLAIGGVGQIFVWDTLHPALKSRGVLPAQSGDIEQVAWHPDGRLLASESDGLVILWNTRTEMEEVRSSVHSQDGLLFSPDGTRLGLFRQGESVGLLEVDPGFGRQSIGHPHHKISGAAWSPEDGRDEAGHPIGGRVLVTAADDAVRFWNREGESVGAIRVTGARSVLWSKRHLFVTGREGIIRWPVQKSDDGRSPQLALGPREVMDPGTGWERAALSVPDANGVNRWLVVARPDRILVTTPDGGRPPVRLENEHGAAFVAISRDDRWLAAGSLTDGVYVWSLEDGRQVAHIGVNGSANVGFTIDGDNHDRSDWLVIGSGSDYAFCKIGTWTIEHRIPTKLGVTNPGAMAFSSRGTALALESKLNEIEIIYPRPPFQFEVAKPDFARQSALSFSPKGGLLVDVDQDWHIIMWHLPRLRAELKPLGLDWKIFGPLIDPDLPLVDEVTVEDEP